MIGDYVVDEFGFDPHLNDAVFLPLLRVFSSWFRVEVSGIENLPESGAALIVANHAGVLPFDGLMASVAVHDHHPTNRDLRLLAADMVFNMPMMGQAADVRPAVQGQVTIGGQQPQVPVGGVLVVHGHRRHQSVERQHPGVVGHHQRGPVSGRFSIPLTSTRNHDLKNALSKGKKTASLRCGSKPNSSTV